VIELQEKIYKIINKFVTLDLKEDLFFE
jgi:hypothetical protein